MTDKPQNDPTSKIVIEIIGRIRTQPELKDAWDTMPNAEKNYITGDFYNLVASRPASDVLEVHPRPNVICLCGSTRFTREMLVKQWELTKDGNIVLSWCALPDEYYHGEEKAHIGDQEGVKNLVDEVHKRKIDLSDRIFVINIGGYIGTSTRSEIDYAISHGKPVNYLEELRAGRDEEC